MTPTLPTRAGLSGIFSLLGSWCFVGLDRGDDGLYGDPTVGDQLATRTPGGSCERRGPQVLPDEHPGGRHRIHGRREMRDIVSGQQLGELGLERLQLAELGDVGQLRGLDVAVVVFGEDQHIDHADGPGVDQRQQLGCHLAGEAARSRGELHDDVVEGS
jgi:hypothetical protein